MTKTLLEQLTEEDRIFGDLTGWRGLGNKHSAHKETVLSGYWKQMLFALKPAVKAQADKNVSVN